MIIFKMEKSNNMNEKRSNHHHLDIKQLWKDNSTIN